MTLPAQTKRSDEAARRSDRLIVHWLLRIAVAAEFIGHGAFGLIGKEGWLPYYAVFGIPESAAWILMPITGAVDVSLGVLILTRPMRLPLAYMAFWGLFTATLRPLAGESGWELVERSYNYGVPFVLLLMSGPLTPFSARRWLARIRPAPPSLTKRQLERLGWVLRLIVAAFLIGHGSLGLFADKALLLRGYESVGLDRLVSDPSSLNEIVGLFEIGLGVLVLLVPATSLLVFVVVWKLAIELLYVTMGARGSALEVIERGGAYAAPLALIYLKSLARRSGESNYASSIGDREEVIDP